MSNLVKLHDLREFVRKLTDDLILAAATDVVTTLTITAEQAELLKQLIDLYEACSCRTTALESAGFFEITTRTTQLAKSIP